MQLDYYMYKTGDRVIILDKLMLDKYSELGTFVCVHPYLADLFKIKFVKTNTRSLYIKYRWLKQAQFLMDTPAASLLYN